MKDWAKMHLNEIIFWVYSQLLRSAYIEISYSGYSHILTKFQRNK